MSAKCQNRTFNENPVSTCSAILASSRTMVRAHAGCKKGHRLARWPFSLNCRSKGWTSGSSPINAKRGLSSRLVVFELRHIFQ